MIENPQDWEAAARPIIEAVGGKLLSMYFCFGSSDIVAIIEAPDDKSVAACSMAIGASGAFSAGATTSLMTSGEAMKAMQAAQAAAAVYKPPTG